MLVRERRKELQLTQGQLGERLGISGQAISNWERGHEPIPTDRYEELASALELDVLDLLGGARYVDESLRLAWAEAVTESDLSLRAWSVLMRLGLDRDLTRLVQGRLEYLGSLRRIAESTRNLTLQDVEACWQEVLTSGFVEQVTDAEWSLALKFPK